MNTILTDSVWQRKGVSVLWDNKVLTRINRANQVISLRQFFSYYEQGWPLDSMPFIDDSQLLVAGLDAALDTLSAEEAEEWVKSEVYVRIHEFQNYTEGQYALTFWMTDQNRWKEYISENKYTWVCGPRQKDKEIELGVGIWNGAQRSVKRIEVDSRWIGLYLARIS